jgi:hypothetical protein
MFHAAQNQTFPAQVSLFQGADVVLYGGWVERGIANVELMSKVWNKSKSYLPHFFLLKVYCTCLYI